MKTTEKRIIVIDDQKVVHKGFKRILDSDFVIDSAYQGEEGYKLIQQSLNDNRPYQVAFVDMRMPPGWNGLTAIENICKIDSEIQLVICTAHSDYSWEELNDKIGESDRLLFLKKPFDAIEVRQLAKTLHRKWVLNREVVERIDELQKDRESDDERKLMRKIQDLEKEICRVNDANAAKSEFVANISHELRTPMHGILSFAKYGMEDATKEGIDRGELVKDFQEIRDSAVRLMRILNDILDLSKLEARKVEYIMDEDDIVVAIDTVFSELALVAGEKNLTFKMDIVDQDTSAYFDATRILQVLRNLISNAIKFSHPDGKIFVEVTNEQIDGEENMVVTVINSGVGISQIELESIFDKYIQSRKSHSGEGGTGLGLPICKEIVQGHHGKIWAESSNDGLTKFIFTLKKHSFEK